MRTDFCKLGFGAVVLQRSDDPESIEAMKQEMDGGPCKFDLRKNGPKLKPIAFSAKKLTGYQQYLHSSVGEGLAFKYGINKFHHIFFWSNIHSNYRLLVTSVDSNL